MKIKWKKIWKKYWEWREVFGLASKEERMEVLEHLVRRYSK